MTINVRKENRPFLFTLKGKALFCRSPNDSLIFMKSMFTIDILFRPQPSLGRQIRVRVNISPRSADGIVTNRMERVIVPKVITEVGGRLGIRVWVCCPRACTINDIACHKYVDQDSFKNLVQTEEKLPVATPTVTFKHVAVAHFWGQEPRAQSWPTRVIWAVKGSDRWAQVFLGWEAASPGQKWRQNEVCI